MFSLDQINKVSKELETRFDVDDFVLLVREIGKAPDEVLGPADLVRLPRRQLIRTVLDVANREEWLSKLVVSAIDGRPSLLQNLENIFGSARLLEMRRELARDTDGFSQALDRYLGAFQGPAADPGEFTRDEWGITTPFVDLKWSWRSPEQVDSGRLKWVAGTKWERIKLFLGNFRLRNAPAIQEGAAQVLIALLGRRTHSDLRGGPEKVPWLVHVGAGGGKTTLALRALGELAQDFRPGGADALLPVYIRLASVSVESLRERLAAPPEPDSLLSLIHGLAFDPAGLLPSISRDSTGSPVAVVMDGLDEIPDPRLRAELLDWLVEAGAAFCIRNSLAITCRTLDVPPPKARRSGRRFSSKLRPQYMHVLPIDSGWQDEWCRARCDRSESTARWLLSQVERLRQDVLDDVRTGRASFLSSPFLFTSLMKWLLDGHRQSNDWVPQFPRDGNELMATIVDLNLREGVEYALASLPGGEASPPDAEKLQDTTLQVLGRLAFDQLIKPAEGWDVDETHALGRLAAAASLGEFEPALVRLAFEKSRLLVRVDTGAFGRSEVSPRRAFAHPLILEYLGSRYLAEAIGRRRDLDEVCSALSSVWVARRLPDAVQLGPCFPLPGVVIEALMERIFAARIEPNLDLLTSSDASAIFFQILELARKAGKEAVEEGERYRIAVSFMSFLSWRGWEMLAERPAISTGLVCQWLDVGTLEQVSASARTLGQFAAALRARAQKKECAQALATFFEKLTQAPFVTDPIRDETLRHCAERLTEVTGWDQPGSSSWPNRGANRASVEALRTIEGRIKRATAAFEKQKKRQTKTSPDWWFIGRLLLYAAMVGLSIWWAIHMYDTPVDRRAGPGLPRVLTRGSQFLLCELWAAGWFLLVAGLVYGLGVALGSGLLSAIERRLPRIPRLFRDLDLHWLTRVRVERAVRSYGSNDEARNVIEAFGAQRPHSTGEATVRLAFLIAMQEVRIGEGYPEDDLRVHFLKAAADNVARNFQALRERELQGYRSPTRKEPEPAALETEEVLAADRPKSQFAELISVGVGAIGGLLLYCLPLASPIPSIGLWTSLALALGGTFLAFRWSRDGLPASPGLRDRVYLAGFTWLARVSMLFAALMIGFRTAAGFPDLNNNLHSNWFASIMDRSQAFCASAGIAVAVELLLAGAANFLLSRLMLRLPEFAEAAKRRWWKVSFPGAVLILPMVAFLIASGRMTPDPTRLLQRQTAEILRAEPLTVARTLSDAVSEMGKELHDISDGTQPDTRVFQKSLASYLDALDRRAKLPSSGMATVLWGKWEIGDDKNRREISLWDGLRPLVADAQAYDLVSPESLAAADRVVGAACVDAVYEEYRECSSSSFELSGYDKASAAYVELRNPEQAQQLFHLADSAEQRSDAAVASLKLSDQLRAEGRKDYTSAMESFERGDIPRECELLEGLRRKDPADASYAGDLVESLILLGRNNDALQLLPEAIRLNRYKAPQTMILVAYQAVATDLDGKPKEAARVARHAAALAGALNEKPRWTFSGGSIWLQRTRTLPQRATDLIREFDTAKGTNDIIRALNRYADSLDH